jgi:hypothetical protein
MADMEMPLIPQPDYIVAELVQIIFFTEGGLQGAGGRGTPILRIVAKGDNVKGWEIGDYFVTHPNNSELVWGWLDPNPLQILKADVICAKLESSVIEEMLARMERFNKPLKLPAHTDPGLGVQGPPAPRIFLPGDDLPPPAKL